MLNKAQRQYKEVKAEWDEVMGKLDNGFNFEESYMGDLENRLIEAELTLEKLITPILLQNGLDKQEVKRLFAVKTDEAMALVMRLGA
ncbi:MAG TPA: hypothetical protein VFK33_00770 [Bacillales bacterium]|nr:hypothetical protein [Bacillales bacterium]